MEKLTLLTKLLVLNVTLLFIVFITYYFSIYPFYKISVYPATLFQKLLLLSPKNYVYPRGMIVGSDPMSNLLYASDQGFEPQAGLVGVEQFFYIEDVSEGDEIKLISLNGSRLTINDSFLSSEDISYKYDLAKGDLISLYWGVEATNIVEHIFPHLLKRKILEKQPDSLYVHWSNSWIR